VHDVDLTIADEFLEDAPDPCVERMAFPGLDVVDAQATRPAIDFEDLVPEIAEITDRDGEPIARVARCRPRMARRSGELLMLALRIDPRALGLLGIVVAVGCGGNNNPSVECKETGDCNLSAGGMCQPNDATGHKWCEYPDPSCPAGYRWRLSVIRDS
jgi:hypothetical protein